MMIVFLQSHHCFVLLFLCLNLFVSDVPDEMFPNMNPSGKKPIESIWKSEDWAKTFSLSHRRQVRELSAVFAPLVKKPLISDKTAAIAAATLTSLATVASSSCYSSIVL